MRNLPLLFSGIFFCMAFSWSVLVLIPSKQFGLLTPVALEEGDPKYPEAIVGVAQQGKQAYMDLGCMYCHSQQVRRKGYGADYERGWGDRKSVARDYIRDDRVQLGTMRTGPDLFNIGDRPNDAQWHHKHLYDPQITSPGSNMPPFAFLYKIQKKGEHSAPNALQNIPEQYAPEEGYEVVPTPRAEAVVAYLLSLKHNYELPESRNSQ